MSYFKKGYRKKRKARRALEKKVFPRGIQLTHHALIRFFERKRGIKFKDVSDFFKSTTTDDREATAEIIKDKINTCLHYGKARERTYCGDSYSLYLGLRMVAIVRDSIVVTIYNLKGKENEQ